jgi:DNA primase
MKVVDDLKIRSRKANEILGVCPVCDCKDANFNTNKLTWRCWHCNASGRIIPEEGYVFKEEEEPVLDIPEIRRLYTSIAQKYHNKLTQPVLDYLKGRGLTQQTIDSFLLGFCPTDFFDDYSNRLAEDSGILYQNYPVLTNRITIPYVAGGEVTDLRGRIVNSVFTYKDGTPTYSSLSGNHKTRGATFLFNYDIIANNHRVILTEGEFKAIVAYQHGFPVVAMPGIRGWQKEWTILFQNKELILAPDSDGFGGTRSPAYQMVSMIAQDVPTAKVAILRLLKRTEKEDIDSMIVGGGLKTFERAVEGAIPVKEWLIQEERKGYGRKRS